MKYPDQLLSATYQKQASHKHGEAHRDQSKIAYGCLSILTHAKHKEGQYE